jgi:hypothetical protein
MEPRPDARYPDEVSDQRLRELERRWTETGAVTDEAAYLRERVRVGDLTPERLELAARCGHAGAQAAVDGDAGPPGDARDAFVVAVDALSEGPRRRFACDCAERVLPRWSMLFPQDARPQEAIAVARRYAAGLATDAALEEARSAAERASWCTALDAAEAAEAAHAAASRAPGFACWAADVALRLAARTAARSRAQVTIVPFQDIDFGPFDQAVREAAAAERAWQYGRLAEQLLGRAPAGSA